MTHSLFPYSKLRRYHQHRCLVIHYLLRYQFFEDYLPKESYPQNPVQVLLLLNHPPPPPHHHHHHQLVHKFQPVKGIITIKKHDQNISSGKRDVTKVSTKRSNDSIFKPFLFPPHCAIKSCNPSSSSSPYHILST